MLPDAGFPKKHLVMACQITGTFDVNRKTTLKADDFSLVQAWADAIVALQMYGIVFHNTFSPETCAQHENEHISFVRVEHDTRYNPNVYRYLVYRDFLRAHPDEIEALFVTDISDVVAIKNPFEQPLFLQNPNALFCGDEPKPLHNEWMHAHSEHLRSKITGFAAYEKQFAEAPLLNCGIIGGYIQVMGPFIAQLAQLHEQYNHDNQTAYTGDMGAFNFLVRSYFNERLFHGAPCSTVFKAYETERRDCWFRHK